MEQGREKRAHKRIYRKLIAHFHIRPLDDGARGKWDIVTVRNLSAGGVLFNYDRDLGEGLEVDFRINFPGSEVPVVCSAKIVRVDPAADYGIFPTAAVFTGIDSDDRRDIEYIAAQLELGKPTGTSLDKDWSDDRDRDISGRWEKC